ncbi:MAG: hypothetical protein ACOVRK_02385 [Chryseobacterium taeanense]
MRQKEKDKILQDLKEVVKKILLNGFKNRMHRVVATVEQIQILNYEIVPDEDDRDLVLVHHLQIGARVFVVFSEDGKSSDNILLKNRNPLRFRYNKEIDNYKLDEDSTEFYDAT